MLPINSLLMAISLLLFSTISQIAMSAEYPLFDIEERRILRFGCPDTIKINKSKDPWNAKDDENLYISKKKGRCNVQWPGNPCLVKFVKLDVQSYYAECGKKRPL